MKSTHGARKKLVQTTKADSQAELAVRAATAITEAVAAHGNRRGAKAGQERITVHVHIGDVIMMGFDEAVDAEEWGARETTTEVAGGKGAKKAADAEENKDKNRNVTRKINFRKGAIELSAVEDSKPATRKVVARKKAAASKKTARKSGTRAATR